MKLTQHQQLPASIKKTIITTALAGLFVLTATPTTAIPGLSVDAFAATTAAQTAFKQTQAQPTQQQQVKVAAFHIVVNGTDVTSQVTAVAPILTVNNRTMLPLRPLANALGVNDSNIKWEAEYKTASLSKDSTTVEVVQEHDHLIINGSQASKALDAKALNYNNRLYLPTRAIGEALNCTIEWEASTKTVNITTGSGSGSQQPQQPGDYEKPTAETIKSRMGYDLNHLPPDNLRECFDRYVAGYRAMGLTTDQINGNLREISLAPNGTGENGECTNEQMSHWNAWHDVFAHTPLPTEDGTFIGQVKDGCVWDGDQWQFSDRIPSGMQGLHLQSY